LKQTSKMGGFLRLALPLIAFLSLFPLYTRYKAAAAPVPPGVYLAGLDLSRYKEPADIESVLAANLSQPIAVYYGETRLVLRPQEVDFQINTAAMLAEAQQYLEGPEFIEIALRKLAGIPPRRRDIATRYSYDGQKLAEWLGKVGEELDHAPQPGRALPPQWSWQEGSGEDGPAGLPERTDGAPFATLPTTFEGEAQRSWQWTAGTPGQRLLLEESAGPVLEALGSLEARTAYLALEETAAPGLTMDALGRQLNAFTSDFPGFAAIYVQDLTTGEEATVDVDVAFSGMSTMKIAIASEAFRQMDDFESELVGQWIDHALGESNNAAANRVLQWVGDGDIYAGGRRVTEMMRTLGFTNSYIQTGFDDKSIISKIPTEANSRTDWNTNPDTHLQSTPAEMGRLLAAIYRCQGGEGLLIDTFGGEITPEECGAILFYVSHDEFTEMVWGGLPRPEETWIIHKHGFVNEAHSDLALIWGPSGPYVLAVYLWSPGWMNWHISNRTMKAVSRIVWNFFAFKSDQEGIEASPPLTLSPPPNYVPVNSYSSRAALSGQ